MKQFIALLFFLNLLSSCQNKEQSPKAFSLHLFQEPIHLDPAKQRGSSASYFFHNTLRGLYRMDSKKGLTAEGGSCQWISNLRLQCDIKDQFWSNGEAVTAQDYIRSFRHLVDPNTASPRAHILSHIKNTTLILKGKVSPEKLGVYANKKQQLLFEFDTTDSEFLYKLTSTALLPLHTSHSFTKSDFKNFIVNGPYEIESWSFGKEMLLKPNPFYKQGHPQRPLVRFYFIDDEMTAFRLYESKKLSLLRRTPSKLIEQIKKRQDFLQIPMARFDYIGFGESLSQNKNLRLALAHSVDYEKLKTLLHALGRPGCPSLPAGWIDNPPCYDFDLKKAKSFLNKVPAVDLKKSYKLKVSQQGGNDIKKQAEFFQNQWKKHLGIIVEITQVEQKVFLSQLRTSPPDIFRKGVGLDRPTCLSALETFSTDSKQNFIHLKNKTYFKILKQMQQTKQPRAYKRLCRQAISTLINQGIIIPLGEMHFSLLASPNYEGWSINSMNQLDLSQVHSTKK